MSTINVTTLQKNLSEILKTVATGSDKVTVATPHGNVAMVSEEYLRSLEETCALYSIPCMQESIAEGERTPLAECETLNWEDELK